MKHIDELEKGEKIKRPFIGISYANITDTSTLRRYNVEIDESIENGMVIVDISKDSAAEKAELKVGDVIIKIEGESIKNVAHLKYLLYKHKVGDTIKLTVIRGNTEKNIEVTLDERKDE